MNFNEMKKALQGKQLKFYYADLSYEHVGLIEDIQPFKVTEGIHKGEQAWALYGKNIKPHINSKSPRMMMRLWAGTNWGMLEALAKRGCYTSRSGKFEFMILN